MAHRDAANAISTLLDYYVAGEIVPAHRAQNAWETLITVYRDSGLGADWTTSRVAEQFLPRGQMFPAPNPADADDCEACMDNNGDCRFHTGVRYGHEQALNGITAAMKAFSRDPEQIAVVLENDERNQRAEHEQQVRDQVSPIGGGLSEHEKGMLNTPSADESSSRWPDEVTIELPGECLYCGLQYRRWLPTAETVVCKHCRAEQ